MQRFLENFDRLAGIGASSGIRLWLERLAYGCLALMALSMPHSIAATQTAWLLGMLAWLIRQSIPPRPKLIKTPLDIALWFFFGWTALSSFLSYAPDISIDKLRGAALFLIVYFVANLIKSGRSARFLASILLASCMVAAFWAPLERLIGRGVEINGVKPEGPLGKALLMDGDTLLRVNKKKAYSPEEIEAAIRENESSQVEFYRPDFNFSVEVKRADLLSGGNPMANLGIENWKKSRNWRSAGFYGHYTTFAEALQLIGSLAIGILLALLFPGGSFSRERLARSSLLIVSIVGIATALLLSATRASQLSLAISAFAMALIGGSRKMLLILAGAMIPLAIFGAIYLQQSRKVAFFDANDNSTTWRQTVYKEGIGLATKNGRHIFFGVGMDSIKRYSDEWGLFDNGKLPKGHFHSTPLQIIVERGFPAILLWLWILWLYLRSLWRGIKAGRPVFEKGILLGSFGGAIGFFVSGLAHYNLGDAEVAMIFFWLMGLSLALLSLPYRADSARA